MTTMYTRSAARASLDRLARCSQYEAGTSTWWACLARRLDELSEELALGDVEGLIAQVQTDAPEMAADATRLAKLDAQVRQEIVELRLWVGAEAGSRDATGEVRRALEMALHRVRTLDRYSDDLLIQAYERDLGGE